MEEREFLENIELYKSREEKGIVSSYRSLEGMVGILIE